MPALLPWLALGALVLAFRRRGYGVALVAGLVWWSALLALGSEVLSVGDALTRAGTSVYWGVVAAATGFAAWRARAAMPVASLAPGAGSGARVERVLALGVAASAAAIVAAILVTTLLMPANAQDVMTYHLPRVLHWAQGASLEPFPTHDSRQLYHPPFAELVDLHFLLLSGGDRWVGPLRVLFLAGAGVAAAQVAARLAPERPRFATVGAVAVALSAPTTLTLVHGGKNDPVAGFFLLALALALLVACERPGWEAALAAGLALGLALLTKTTSFLYAAPFVALFGAVLVLRHRRRAWRPLVALAALPPLLMAGHMARNVAVYGHPLFDRTRQEMLSVEGKGPGATWSNVLRFTSAHLGGPSADWNASLERGVRAAHGWFGLDADDPRTTAPGERFAVPNALKYDSYAGSPAQLVLALLAVGLVVARPTLRRARTPALYALALVGAALLACASLRWSSTVTRLQSPLFLLAAPLIGAALAGLGAWVPTLHAFLLAASLPWILCSIERRLFGPYAALHQPRHQLLFRNVDRPLQAPAEEAAAWIGARGHRNVGVQPDDVRYAEYPLWLTLRDHVPGLRLEHVNATGPAATPAEWAKYRDFVPDVVVRVLARGTERRRAVEASLTVGGRGYRLSFENERVAVYER
jgi:hypothetical protein